MLRVGARGSKLARAQADLVRDALASRCGFASELVAIKTSGDRIQDRPLAEAGGKGLFARELEEALLAEHIELAVHSLKDLPTILPAGLAACRFAQHPHSSQEPRQQQKRRDLSGYCGGSGLRGGSGASRSPQ